MTPCTKCRWKAKKTTTGTCGGASFAHRLDGDLGQPTLPLVDLALLPSPAGGEVQPDNSAQFDGLHGLAAVVVGTALGAPLGRWLIDAQGSSSGIGAARRASGGSGRPAPADGHLERRGLTHPDGRHTP
ncbi:hypothetical protein [Streptomyces sp. NPDC002779]|uniref:hypothetical protein n=1 Tax=Streptomyces sp. NPDC002779 TaxID=3364664 RepID=UPI00367ED94F